MAADVPRKKSAAKQAPAKKVAVKKATAKKAVAKQSATKKAPAKKVAAKKVASPETVVLAPPAPMEAPEPALAAPPDVVESQLATPTTPTFVETLLRLDWRQTAKVAGPSFLVLFAASCVTATSLLLAPTSDQPV